MSSEIEAITVCCNDLGQRLTAPDRRIGEDMLMNDTRVASSLAGLTLALAIGVTGTQASPVETGSRNAAACAGAVTAPLTASDPGEGSDPLTLWDAAVGDLGDDLSDAACTVAMDGEDGDMLDPTPEIFATVPWEPLGTGGQIFNRVGGDIMISGIQFD